ncbi:MAG: 9-O-acetylesterase [Phycisphaerae bacterium]|nr:9-O-acetylesterase [Phycisphaerae bacterium]
MKTTHSARIGKRLAVALILAGLSPAGARAEIRLPAVFGSHMVLQQDLPLTIWGWAQPEETVTVQFLTESEQVKANDRGEWRVTLAPADVGGPHTLTVSGSSTVKFEDVMVGEVWLCSGQSNMEMGVAACKDAEKEIADADHPGIRLLKVAKKWAPVPQQDIGGGWKPCSPKSVAEGGWGGFSAAAYYFGRELHRQLDVPVGLIDSSWGGTVIQTWTPPEGFAAVPALKADYERVQLGDPRTPLHQQRLEQVLAETQQWLEAARKALNDRGLVPPMPTYPGELQPPSDVQHATALYNGMIHPLCPFTLRGAIWYQGESNLGEGRHYTERMKALISGWRQLWGLDELPFYFVQIAPFNYGGNPETEALFWEAQRAAAEEIPNTGMVVINDISNLRDIHPNNKQDVGRRLALWALAKTYGRTNVVYSGPVYKAMSIEDDKIRVTFDHAGGGLASRDGQPLTWFEIIDAEEGGFVKAEAKIDGASVIVSSPEVKKPVAVRFAWSMLAEPNLMNAEGLPAGAFRAGNVPVRDPLVMNVPEARQYRLVYDLDLGKLGETINYDADHRAGITRSFDRIAYFVELTSGEDVKYLYVSMDAFTDDLGKIGVPTVASQASFQQNVANMNVFSNVQGIVTGTGLADGNIEFWPHNYAATNAAKVPQASSNVYDFGDQIADPVAGYGSMQVHNHKAKQTLFAINHWRAGQGADLGIGNRPKDNPDWTFSSNAGSYSAKRLRVLVRCK